jgi:hypothetical protein
VQAKAAGTGSHLKAVYGGCGSLQIILPLRNLFHLQQPKQTKIRRSHPAAAGLL